MNYFISSDWMLSKKGKPQFRHYLGDSNGVVLKAKTHEKLIRKIVSWLTGDSIIVRYDCDNTHVRIHKDGRIWMDTENRIMFFGIDAFMASFGSGGVDQAPDVGRNESTQQ